VFWAKSWFSFLVGGDVDTCHVHTCSSCVDGPYTLTLIIIYDQPKFHWRQRGNCMLPKYFPLLDTRVGPSTSILSHKKYNNDGGHGPHVDLVFLGNKIINYALWIFILMTRWNFQKNNLLHDLQYKKNVFHLKQKLVSLQNTPQIVLKITWKLKKIIVNYA